MLTFAEYERDEVSVNVQAVNGIYLVTPDNLKGGEFIIFACYKDGQMVNVNYSYYSEAISTYPFMFNADYDSVRIMLWDSLDKCKPLCASIEM